MRRLLIDVTRTHQTGLHTGIQRVVRRLLGALQQQCLPGGPVEVLAVVFEAANWFELPSLPAHPLEARPATDSAFSPAARRLRLSRHDTLLMADASWYLDPWPAVDAALQQGARLVGLVHDVFPVLQPQWFRPELEAKFAHHLRQLAGRAELLLVPSHEVGRSLVHHLVNGPAHGKPGGHPLPPVRRQPLGADFLAEDARRPGHGGQPAELPAGVPLHSRFFLSVGTLEPRKNHAPLLDAFDALWAAGGTDHLVLVGASGWSNDATVQRIQHHPQNGQRLHWVRQLPDPQLQALYRRARALVFLSLDEGFGLPVAEAAHLGCPVIANAIPVLREVGGHWPVYLPAGHLPSLLAALQAPPARTAARPGQSPVLVWAQVARQLLQKLAQLPAPEAADEGVAA